MRINQPGSGFHRDSRREARMARKAEREWAIGEQAPPCGDEECAECVAALTCRHDED